MATTGTRKAPNAMNFLLQFEVLGKAGEAADFTDFQIEAQSFLFCSVGDGGISGVDKMLCLKRLQPKPSRNPKGVVMSRAATCLVHSFCKEWNDAGKVARAFNVGKLESEAIVALQSKIHHDIVDELKSATRTRGMRSFVTHDLLSKGIFNTSFTSQVAGLEQWSAYLTNGQNNELVT